MHIPKPSEADIAAFRALVPGDPRVEVKPMGGYVTLPLAWRGRAEATAWVGRALDFVGRMPVKVARPSRRSA